MAQAARVLGPGDALILLDEFPAERFDRLLEGLPLTVSDRAERAMDVGWDREVATRAIALYAEGWAAQARPKGSAARDNVRREAHGRMAAEMERQLAGHGAYTPFGPVRMFVARTKLDGS